MASLSDLPVNVLHNFSECYVQFCALKKTHALLTVRKYFPKQKIDFVCDSLTLNEWSILLRCLKHDKSLNCISIKSRKRATTTVLTKVDTKEKAALLKRVYHPLLYTKHIKDFLMKSLKMCLTNHSELKCLKLEGLPLDNEDMNLITNGLSACKSLLHISFNKSHIGDTAIIQISHILKDKPSILSVDFGDCNVGEQGANALAKLIVCQNLTRQHESWKQSLRDRVPMLDELPGLRRITLNHNLRLGDKAVELMINALVDDQYIKALDLQECGVTSKVAEKLIDLLETNTAIKILDVRCNAKLDGEHLQTIMETLHRNNNEDVHEFTWLHVASRAAFNRNLAMQRGYSFARVPSQSTNMSFLETHSEQPITLAAPPPSPTKLETSRDAHQAPPTKGTKNEQTMSFRKCRPSVASTDGHEDDLDVMVHHGRLPSEEQNQGAVFKMRKAQSYHCKSKSILPNKSLLKSMSKSESVVNESPVSLGALERDMGDTIHSRRHLEVQLAHLKKRSGSGMSDVVGSSRRPPLPGKGGPFGRGVPQIRAAKATAAAKFCEATLKKMSMDQYNRYVFERNKNGISNYVPEPGKTYKEPVNRSTSTKKLLKERSPPSSRIHSCQGSVQSYKTSPKDWAKSSRRPAISTTKRSQVLEFSSDEEEASYTNYRR